MTTATLNLEIQQGATFKKLLTWRVGSPSEPVILTGCTARMQIREHMEAATTLVSLTTENGGILLGGIAGTVDLLISAGVTAALSKRGGVYDLEIIFADGTVKRLVSGSVEITPNVTRG